MWLWEAVGQTPGVQKEGLMFLLLIKEAVCSFPSSPSPPRLPLPPSPFPHHHAHHPLGRMGRRVSSEFWCLSGPPSSLHHSLQGPRALTPAQEIPHSPPQAPVSLGSLPPGGAGPRRAGTETPVRLAEARAQRSLGHSQGIRDIVSPFGTGPGGKRAPGRRGVILRALDTVLPSGRCENRGNSAGRACSPSKDLGDKASARPVHYPEGIEGPSRERSSGDRGLHRRSHSVLRSPGRLQLPPTWSAGPALGPDLPGRPRPRDPTEASPPQDALAVARVASKETPVPRPEQSRPWAGQGPRAGTLPGPATRRRRLDEGWTAGGQNGTKWRPRRPAVHGPRALPTSAPSRPSHRSRARGTPVTLENGGGARGDVAGRLLSGGEKEMRTAGCSLRSCRK